MIDEHRTYQAYLLRLWRVNTGRTIVWHASLEDSRTGERKGFADLQGLLVFLEEQIDQIDHRNISDKEGLE